MDVHEKPDHRAAASVRAILKPLAWAATIGMFIVVLMGATVTNTGSAEGCGRSWPLCHGQLIPEFAVNTLIEFSHRAVTGVETMLILALAAGAWATYREYREIRVLSVFMVGTLFLQAGMGAWAVLYPQVPLVLALHFGISLAAFASVLLTATFVHEAEAGFQRRTHAVPTAYARLAWLSTMYLLIVVYLGAYVRHTGFQLACLDWPLCNGMVMPGFAGPAGVVFVHRLAALGGVLLLTGLAIWSWQLRETRPDLARMGAVAFALIIAQSLTGALIVATRFGLWSALAHAGVMALLFGSVCSIGLAVRSVPTGEATTAGAKGNARRVPVG
jgi:cytochrome c oxidase assembly protein subunit 15